MKNYQRGEATLLFKTLSDPTRLRLTKSAGVRRNVRMRIDRYASCGSTEDFAASRPTEASRLGGCAARRKVDALSMGSASRSIGSARPARIARLDGERPGDEWRTEQTRQGLLQNQPEKAKEKERFMTTKEFISKLRATPQNRLLFVDTERATRSTPVIILPN